MKHDVGVHTRNNHMAFGYVSLFEHQIQEATDTARLARVEPDTTVNDTIAARMRFSDARKALSPGYVTTAAGSGSSDSRVAIKRMTRSSSISCACSYPCSYASLHRGELTRIIPPIQMYSVYSCSYASPLTTILQSTLPRKRPYQ